MLLFSDAFLEGLETALVNANSEEQAKALLTKYTLPEIKAIQKHLNAYKHKATTKETILQAIVDCTYKAVRTSKLIRNIEQKEYEIWSEGYTATGQSSGAMLLGYCHGTDLKDACINYAKQNAEFASYFSAERMTHWGCRLFDNREDAQRSFG